MFRAQADWTFILTLEVPAKELGQWRRHMPPQAYQTSQYVVPRGGIFLRHWPSSFAGTSKVPQSKVNQNASLFFFFARMLLQTFYFTCCSSLY
jgi:hypothetical protein